MTPDMCDASVIGFVLPLEEQQQHAVLVAVSNIYISAGASEFLSKIGYGFSKYS